jgi:hypothetical protein
MAAPPSFFFCFVFDLMTLANVFYTISRKSKPKKAKKQNREN